MPFPEYAALLIVVLGALCAVLFVMVVLLLTILLGIGTSRPPSHEPKAMGRSPR